MAMSKNTAVSRRGLFGLAATASVIGGCARQAEGSPAAERALSFGVSVAVYGANQAGVDRPAAPQGHLELGVFDLEDAVEPGAPLARLGDAVVDVRVGEIGSAGWARAGRCHGVDRGRATAGRGRGSDVAGGGGASGVRAAGDRGRRSLPGFGERAPLGAALYA
jgi:hypothetical protein